MTLKQVAAQLLRDFDACTPGKVFEQLDLDLSIEDAYDLQFRVAAMRESRGEHVVGYKVGCISKTMQRQLGIDHPVFGQIWDTEIYPSGSRLDTHQFDNPAIEGEFAVTIRDDIPTTEWLKKNPEVISAPFLVIELHNYVFRGSKAIRAVELVATNTIHAGIVFAENNPNSSGSNLKAKLRVDRNSESLGESLPTHLQSGLSDILNSVVEHLAKYGRQLKRDQILLTGSPLPLWHVKPRDQIIVRSEGFENVSCSFS